MKRDVVQVAGGGRQENERREQWWRETWWDSWMGVMMGGCGWQQGGVNESLLMTHHISRRRSKQHNEALAG